MLRMLLMGFTLELSLKFYSRVYKVTTKPTSK